MTKLTKRGGFTLIELLLVIGIIAILAAIVIVAINPNKQLADARNAQRRSDVTTILNAIYQFSIDNSGNLPTTLSGTTLNIQNKNLAIMQSNGTATCPTTPAAGFAYGQALTSNAIDLCPLVVLGKYLVSLPKDPSVAATATGSAYTVKIDGNNRITVSAYKAENGATISVTR